MRVIVEVVCDGRSIHSMPGTITRILLRYVRCVGIRKQSTPLNDFQNGGFFQLAARLARYTGNQTYVDWTEKTWNWISQSSLYDPNTSVGTKIYDGAGIDGGCSNPNKAQYSYNYGILIGGLAYIYNHTEDAKWLEPLYGISQSALTRVIDDVPMLTI